MEPEISLSCKDLVKTYPGVIAMDHVNFELRKGEVHALLGENGAGKSTLIKSIAGAHQCDSGTITIDGKEFHGLTPLQAKEMGVEVVYQEFNQMPSLSVAENIYLTELRGKRIVADQREFERKAAELFKEMNLDLNPKVKVASLTNGYKQMVEIAKALSLNAKIIIFDEPTSSLDDNEVEKLFGMMRRLRNQGVGIIFVTHFLEQVYAVCDGITVLRTGQLVGEYSIEELPRVKLVAAMMGKDFDDLAAIRKGENKDFSKEALEIEAKGLSHAGKIKPYDLEIHKGEVVGLTGLLGSGRSELARTIYGADRSQTGTLKVDGKERKIKNPIDAMQLGMGYLPDDRKAEGIVGDLSVRENIILAMQAKLGPLHKIPMQKQIEIADKYIELLQIKTASRETLIKQLSGGNQQKVILARWLATDPDFLILDEPTRGIDVGTKTEIQKLVVQLAEEGKSLIFISSEIEEMLRVCNKMAVLRDGAKVGEISGNMTQESVLSAIAGGESNE